MPNRIIKESITTSEEIDRLTPEQEVFFYRLMVACDDYGLMDARTSILKARCYPLKAVESSCIQKMLDALHTIGLIQLYAIDGKPYLKMTNWEKHQTIRAHKSKYPLPTANDFICKQMQADVPVIQSNPIQSLSVSHDKIVFDGSSFQNLNGQMKVWADAYPAIDIEAEVKKAAAWIVANPKNKKKDYGRFLNGWLSRSQDKAPRVQQSEFGSWK